MTARGDSPARLQRVAVVTVSHRGDDARIAFRQLGALREAGIEVVYIAPEPVVHDDPGVERIVIPRAAGRRRLGSWRAAAAELRRVAADVDVILVHDVEVVPLLAAVAADTPLVWDVHEDVVASVADREWIPPRAHRLVRPVVAGLESLARRGRPLLLAEHRYADRLGDWPVVPNSARVGPPGPERDRVRGRVIYVGRLSEGRGLSTMVELGRRLGSAAEVMLVGSADADVVEAVRRADRRGEVTWTGPLPNPDARRLVASAEVGLSLLRPLPNYVHSMPTKIFEYLASATPVVTTPLPLAVDAVEASGAGLVVGHDDPAAAAEAVAVYLDDPERRRRDGLAGHRWVAAEHNWDVDAARFVAALERYAASG